MHAPSSHMNGGSYQDPPFMWEEGVRIYGTPGVPNNFPYLSNKEIPISLLPKLNKSPSGYVGDKWNWGWSSHDNLIVITLFIISYI